MHMCMSAYKCMYVYVCMYVCIKVCICLCVRIFDEPEVEKYHQGGLPFCGSNSSEVNRIYVIIMGTHVSLRL